MFSESMNTESNTDKRYSAASMFLIFLLLAIVFNFDFLLGPYSLVRHHDAFDTEYINLAARGRLFLENGFYGWYPNFAGGMPSFAERVPPYYLPSVISSIVPIWLVYIIWRVGLMALAGYGMYRMLMGFFRLSHPIAVFGAVIFAIYRPAYVHTVFDYAFPIFFVWSMELHTQNLDFGKKAMRIFGLIGILLISYPVITIQSYPVFHLGIVMMFGIGLKNFKGHIFGTILIWTGFVLFFGPHIYRLLEYAPLAHRDFITPFASKGSIPFTYSGITAALGDFTGKFLESAFIRNPFVLFFLFGLPLLRHSRRFQFVTALFVFPSIVHAVFASQLVVLFSGTFLIKMDLVHFHMVNIVSFVLVVAVVLDEMRFLKLSQIIGRAAFAILLLALLRIKPISHVGSFVDISVVQVLSFAMGLSVIAIMKRAEFGKLFPPRVPLLSIIVLAALGASIGGISMIAKHPQNLVQPFRRMYGNHQELFQIAEESRSEVFRVGCAGIHPAVPLSYGLETAGQRGALFNKYYKQFIKALIKPQLQKPEDEKVFDINWYDVFLVPSQTTNCSPPSKCWNMPLLLMLNVKYLISKEPIEGIEEFADMTKMDQGKGLPSGFLQGTRLNRFFTMPLWIYRIKDAFPRGYLADTPVIVEKREEVLRKLEAQSPADLRNKVFLCAQDVRSLTLGDKQSEPKWKTEKGNVQITEYSPDRIVFKGVADSPCFLVVTNNYDSKWTASVNNESLPVYRANHAFQAVYIDKEGPFQVILDYRESTVWWVHMVSLAGLILFVFPAFAWNKTRKESTFNSSEQIQRNTVNRVTHPEGNPQNKKRFIWICGLGGLGMAGLHVLWAVFLFEPAPGWSVQTIKGVMLYNSLIVSLTGILVSLWAVVVLKNCQQCKESHE
jgi:hypothetical protein